jgi:hypothetical protein
LAGAIGPACGIDIAGFWRHNLTLILCIATSFSHVASWAYLNFKAISRNAV